MEPLLGVPSFHGALAGARRRLGQVMKRDLFPLALQIMKLPTIRQYSVVADAHDDPVEPKLTRAQEELPIAEPGVRQPHNPARPTVRRKLGEQSEGKLGDALFALVNALGNGKAEVADAGVQGQEVDAVLAVVPSGVGDAFPGLPDAGEVKLEVTWGRRPRWCR